MEEIKDDDNVKEVNDDDDVENGEVLQMTIRLKKWITDDNKVKEVNNDDNVENQRCTVDDNVANREDECEDVNGKKV